MNNLQKKNVELYRIVYNQRLREFELRENWADKEGEEAPVLYRISEKALIATMLDLKEGK